MLTLRSGEMPILLSPKLADRSSVVTMRLGDCAAAGTAKAMNKRQSRALTISRCMRGPPDLEVALKMEANALPIAGRRAGPPGRRTGLGLNLASSCRSTGGTFG